MATQLKREIVLVEPASAEIQSSSELPLSAPAAEIELADGWLEGKPSVPRRAKWQFCISGKIRCGVCDTVPGKAGIIDRLSFYEGYDEPIAEIPVSVTKTEGQNPARPYPYEGSFEFRLPLPATISSGRPILYQGGDVFSLRVTENALGRHGHLLFDFERVKRAERQDVSPHSASDPERKDGALNRLNATRDYFFNPLLCRIHVPEEAGAEGVTVPTLAARRPIVRGPDDFFYLADVTGAKPQVLLLLPGGVAPPLMRDTHGRSPFRRLLDRVPGNIEQRQEWFRAGFRAGFLDEDLWLMAGAEKVATLSVSRDSLSSSYETPLQFKWNWGRKVPDLMQPAHALVKAVWLDKIANLVFEDLQATGVGPFKGHVVLENWKKLGMDGYPDEQQRVLDFSPEVFDQLFARNGDIDPAKSGRNCGQMFREMLSLMAPLGDPAESKRRTLIKKLPFLELYIAAGKLTIKNSPNFLRRFFQLR